MTVIEEAAHCCEGCGDIVESVDEDGHGKCCHDLPERWRRGSDGLYNQHTGYDSEAEDDDEDERPHCVNCGGTLWTATATQAIDTLENECDDARIRYDWNDFHVEVTCANCDRDAGQDHHIEGY